MKNNSTFISIITSMMFVHSFANTPYGNKINKFKIFQLLTSTLMLENVLEDLMY